MKLPGKTIEQKAFNTRPKIEEHMLIAMDQLVHKENLPEPLQTNDKQYKIAITFLRGCNGIFNFTNKKNKFCCTASIDDDYSTQIGIPPGAYEIECLNNEKKRNIIGEGYFPKATHPLTIKQLSQHKAQL